MSSHRLAVLLAQAAVAGLTTGAGAYEATWASLNTRPFPAWYNQAKFGFKVHWGPYAVPGWGQKYDALGRQEPVFAQSCLYEYFYATPGTPTYDFHQRVYGDAPYGDFGPKFTCELYDPAEWADLFARAGAGYAYLTMKHGDGFCLYDSATQPYWNSVVMGAKRDLLGDFLAAVKARGLRAGVFAELSEASNPECPCEVLNASSGSRRWGNCTSSVASCEGRLNNCTTAYRDYLHAQIVESVTRFDPDILYLDDNAITNFMPRNVSSDWFGSTSLLAWLFNRPESSEPPGSPHAGAPRVVVNDRWGYAARDQRFNYHLCEDTRGSALGYGCSPGFDPRNRTDQNLHDHWAWTFGLGLGFGYNRAENATDYKTSRFILRTLVQAVRLGGNLEVSIGPTSDGRIDNVVQQRLLDVGAWLAVNGEAVYGTTQWKTADGCDAGGAANVSYTRSSDGAVYAIVEGWPPGTTLNLTQACGTPGSTRVWMVGMPDLGDLRWSPLHQAGPHGAAAAASAACGMSVELPNLRLDALSWGDFYAFKLVKVA